MDNLPEDIQNTIYKYKHQMEFCAAIEELNDGVSITVDGVVKVIGCSKGVSVRVGNLMKMHTMTVTLIMTNFECVVCEHQISIEPHETKNVNEIDLLFKYM